MRSTAVALWIALSCLATSAYPQKSDRRFLIASASVVDGTGASARQASVRVRGDRVEAVGNLTPLRGEEVIDAAGLVLTPGFIDTHSHHDWGLADAPAAFAAVSQGVTTIIVGQDGGSQFPLADFFGELERRPVTVNVGSYVGHNTVRRRVLGDDYRRQATATETQYMQLLVEHELAAGALGLSTGLEYDPGIYASTEEVITLARTVAVARGRYISHIRSEDRHLWDALEEAVRIGREADIPVQVSHLKLAMRGLWGEADRLLRLLDDARAQGVDITADVYPYRYWQSTMTVLFPERDFENRATAAFVLSEVVPPEGVLIARYDPAPYYVGKTLDEVATMRGNDPVTTLIDLIAESQATGADESIIATSMAEEDVAQLIAWPHANICSDGELDGRHPRGFGAFPRVLGHYVRDRGVMSFEEAIFKMSHLAAQHVGLINRGIIRPGAYADLVLLDREEVADRATPQHPRQQAVGIERVWVNGTLVYADAEWTGATPGHVVRHGDR